LLSGRLSTSRAFWLLFGEPKSDKMKICILFSLRQKVKIKKPGTNTGFFTNKTIREHSFKKAASIPKGSFFVGWYQIIYL